MQIDHDPEEPAIDRSNRVWWIAWAIVAFAWFAIGYSFGYDWRQIALGAFTGLILAAWATEITGNKLPSWWR